MCGGVQADGDGLVACMTASAAQNCTAYTELLLRNQSVAKNKIC